VDLSPKTYTLTAIEVVPADRGRESVLANLLELYAHDFSEFIELELQPDGRFGYARLPLYWQEQHRHPFLIEVGGHLAGFVFVTQASRLTGDPTVYDMTEFFIVRRYRKRGVGTAVARLIWQRFPGSWEVRVVESNQPAAAFWRAATDDFTGSAAEESLVELDGRHWHVFSFLSPGAAPSLTPAAGQATHIS
jgi:predicted acetyltransferase